MSAAHIVCNFDQESQNVKRLLVISQPPTVGSIALTLKRMWALVSEMLNDVLETYIEMDIALAASVCACNDRVDMPYDLRFRELGTHMMESTKTITPGIHLPFTAKYLQRMGDDITGIAEQVHSMVKATLPDEELPQSENTAYEALNAANEDN